MSDVEFCWIKRAWVFLITKDRLEDQALSITIEIESENCVVAAQ